MKYDPSIYSIDPTGENSLNDLLEKATAVLLDDGVVLTPTDTVYGLVCLPRSARAIKDIYLMKQRPGNLKLPVIVADQAQAENELPLIWNDAARKLADAFWPGPLTIACGVVKNDMQWLAGRDEVGIRAPKYPFIQALAKMHGPLLMTSANRHGEGTPHTVESALDSLAFQPRLVIDGGSLSGEASTLVNVNLPIPVIERFGVIPQSEIERVLIDVR